MPAPGSLQRSNTLGDISLLYVAVIARAVDAHDLDSGPLLAQFGIEPQLLAVPDARISIPRFMRLGHAATALTGNPALGLTMGQLTRPVDAGRAGLAAQTAAVAGEALATLIRFDLLTSQNSRGQPRMLTEPAAAEFYSIKPYNAFNHFVVDSVLAAWTQLLRTVTGQQQVLARVSIEYPDRGVAEAFEHWFGCPVVFGAGHNRIYPRPEVMRMACRDAQPAVHRQLREDCEQALARLRSGWGVRDQVREKLTPLLEGEAPRLEQVAMELGITPWSLQRRLTEAGTGFRELVDRTRQDLALDYIRETRLAFSEIAWLLGFSGPAAFHKAYQRWFGRSPGQHRRAFSEEQKAKGIA